MSPEITRSPIIFDCDDESALAQTKRRIDEALATFSLDELRLLVAEIEQHLGLDD